MRTPIVSRGDFQARAIAGTRAILIALSCEEKARSGLLGFAFLRTLNGQSKWLLSNKVFKSVVSKPDPERGLYPTNKFPIQSFLWSDFTTEPGTTYTFEAHPVYGSPAKPELRAPLVIELTTEEEEAKDHKGHSLWFNRGAIASQAYAKQFDNHEPTDEEMDDPNNKYTKWLSRGLLEACLNFIKSTRKTEKLRACVYEFTYQPVLKAFAELIDNKIDVELIVHGDPEEKNRDAMRAAGLPVDDPEVVHWRTKTKIPHNKFIIKFQGNTPREVWSGSTNITSSGFLGQSNVGHIIHDSAVAKTYFDYWKIIKENPTAKPAKQAIVALTPYPPALQKENSVTCVFSPRQSATMLNWYADRMDDATSCIMFTAAFTVAGDFVGPLSKRREFLRFVLKEKPTTSEEKNAFKLDRNLVVAYGGVLGAQSPVKNGKRVAKRKVIDFPLDRWFVKEALTRSKGNIFFVHTKYLLIDPLSDDPLICTGSANFSENSLTGNDENMVLIRGDTRVADIYLTEFDRLFRHFYFRDVSNELAMKREKGEEPKKVWLDETDEWTGEYFFPGGIKTQRREMFFNLPKSNWVKEAAKHSNKEPVRPKKKKTSKTKRPAKRK